jgi:hypothetical protein
MFIRFSIGRGALIIPFPWAMSWIFIIFRNNLDDFFYFYHGTNVGASSSKACIYNV